MADKKRVEELERRVKELEARKPVEYHYHYHYAAPTYTPIYQPAPPGPYIITWGTNHTSLTTTSN